MRQWIVECYVVGVGHVSHQIGAAGSSNAKHAVLAMYDGKTVTGLQCHEA